MIKRNTINTTFMPNSRCLISLVLFSILLYRCSPSFDLSGNYSSNRSKYQFRLHQDSTFEYSYKFEFSYEHSQGRWSRIGKRKIVLDSYLKNKTVPTKVQMLSGQNQGQANLFFVDINIPIAEKKYYRCIVFINDTLFENKSCDSVDTVLVSAPVRSILFKLSADPRIPTRFMDTLSTNKIVTQSNISNRAQISIILHDSLFNYRVFENDTLKVTRRGLRFYDVRKNQLQYIPKVKEN